MSKLKIIGFDVIYPPGCKEVHEGLKSDELKKRLGDLMKSLENMSEDYMKGYDSLLSETRIEDSVTIVSSETKSLNLQGLLLHLSNEQFRDHHDRDVQLRVAVCLCYIIKIACPHNPFLCYTDAENITQIVLQFLLKCIKELSRLKTKTDKLFLPVYTVLSICCEIDIFHFYTTISGGEKLLAECFHVFFDVIRRSADWGEDIMLSRIITDAMVNLLSSPDVSVSEALVTYLLNLIVDRCSSKTQKEVVLVIFSKCISKLEEQIQLVLQNYLITNEKEEDVSESSDNDDGNNDDDEFCSLDSYKLKLKRSEKIKPKPANKVESGKNTIEPNLEYGCHHVFQMIYEMFKINESIVSPLLPTIEMKLRSTQVTDRKRACRLLGKLFTSSTICENQSHGSLWETFLGRLSDIELEVREICVRVARDLLKSALESPDKCGTMTFVKEKEELVKAFQRRSTDQEESIRYLIVVAVSQILEHSKAIVYDEELDMISDAMFKLLVHQSRDKFFSVRKEAQATIGKLYRKIISDGETRSKDSGEVDLTLGIKNLKGAQKSRAELLLNLILRPYMSTDVEDRIVVERLFNTSLIPYGQDSAQRMKSLLQCLTLCDEPSVLCIHEIFKTQVSVMNIVRETMDLVGEVTKDNVISPVLSQKLREKVKKLSEYLSSKDKVDSLTKLFNLARSDKRLNELLRRFVDRNSTRQVIVKTIGDIKHLLDSPPKTAGDSTAAALIKRKAFINTVKCVLERGAPIIFDGDSVQELLSHCVSTREAMESSSSLIGSDIVPLSRTLRLLHTMLIMSKRLVPVTETYEYLVSVLATIEKKRPCVSVEDLCLSVLAKLVEYPSPVTGHCSPDNSDELLDVRQQRQGTPTLFSDAGTSTVVMNTQRLLGFLTKCCLVGSCGRQGDETEDTEVVVVSHSKNKEKRGPGGSQDSSNTAGTSHMAKWRYDCKVARLASHCLAGLLQWCCHEDRHGNFAALSRLVDEIRDVLSTIVKQCCDCDRYSVNQPVMLTSLAHIGILLSDQYDQTVRSYVIDVIPKVLEDNSSQGQTESNNLTQWQPESRLSKISQVRIQALKLLSRWVVTLRADVAADQKCILYVMLMLRKYIGNYGTEGYSSDTRDTEMSHLRLAAGKCWLRLAQVQSFLPIFEVKWIYRLSSLVHDPCPQVRDEFLRKLHVGLYKLKLPLEYMAMFVFVSKVKSQEYLNTAKKYLQIDITRRRDFLDTYPEYLSDAKKLFGVLPEYVLCYVIHMLAHDPDWKKIDDDESISDVKQCLWFVMEPILKMNENYSFIRKLLERIKHALDAAEPNNTVLNEKLYIASDIALGLLISKQSSYDLKEYPVELKLPRTRYVAAPNTFFNPDFANILLDNCTRARIQFSPTPKSRQTIKNFMPLPLIKGHQSGHENNKGEHGIDDRETSTETNQHSKTVISKTKKHTAKIVMGVPEMESEVVSGHSLQASSHQIVHKTTTSSKRKASRSESPRSDKDEMSASQASVTQRGRICKPNFRVMKDMVSPSKKDMSAVTKKRVSSPSKKRLVSPSKKSILNISPAKKIATTATQVRIEGTVSVNIERLIADVVQQALVGGQELHKENGAHLSPSKTKASRKQKQTIDVPKSKSPNKATESAVISKEIENKTRGRKRKEMMKSPSIDDVNIVGRASPQKRLTRHSLENVEPPISQQSDVFVKESFQSTKILAPPLIRANVQSAKEAIPEDKGNKRAKAIIRNSCSANDLSLKKSEEKKKNTRTSIISDFRSKSPQTKTRITRHSVFLINPSDKSTATTTDSIVKPSQDEERRTGPVASVTDSTISSPNKERLTRHSLFITESSPNKRRTTRETPSVTDSTPKSSQDKDRVTRHTLSATDSTPKSSQERVTRHTLSATDSTPKSSQERVTRHTAFVTDSTPKSSHERVTRHTAFVTDSTPKPSQDKERVTRHSASVTGSTPKSSPNKERVTRHTTSVTDSTPKSSQERVTRHTASVTESTPKSSPNKERVTRHSDSVKQSTPQSLQGKVLAVIPLTRPSKSKSPNKRYVSPEVSGQGTKAQKQAISAISKKAAIVKSPIEVTIRSKRLASVFASEALIKKAKL